MFGRNLIVVGLLAGALAVSGCGARTVDAGAAGSGPVGASPPIAVSPVAASSQTVTLPLAADATTSLADGLALPVSIGGGADRDLEVDTGSRGIVVARSAIGSQATDTGQAGSVEYTSDGLILSGEYFQATVTFHPADSTVDTIPIRVLGVTSSGCDSAYPKCVPETDLDHVGMLGVGYGEYARTQLPSAEDNPFLELSSMQLGAVRRAYVITRTGITLGATSAQRATFEQVALPKPTTDSDGPVGQPGSWGPAPGCFALPDHGDQAECGTVLVDTGIGTMIVGLPAAQRPSAIAASIPNGTRTQIRLPASTDCALSYTVTIGSTADPLAPQGDPAARWAAAGPFVNTGRHLLAGYDYLFDAVTGRIGFRADPS